MDINRLIWAAFQSTPSSRRATDGFVTGAIMAQQFQSTPSSRRATAGRRTFCRCAADFNPRPPRGGRPKLLCVPPEVGKFQSTPSSRRATKTGRDSQGVR